MSPRERNLLILLGVLAVGALAYFVLVLGGGDEPQDQTAPTLDASPPPETPEPAETPTPEPPRSVTFLGGRDPFVPLIVVPTTETTDGTTETGDTTGDTTGDATGDTTDETTDGDTGDTTDGTADGQDAQQNGQQEEPEGIAVTGRPNQNVVLVEVIDADSAKVQVDRHLYSVSAGQSFARHYELLSVDGSCVRVRYGDEAFTLCEGE